MVPVLVIITVLLIEFTAPIVMLVKYERDYRKALAEEKKKHDH